MTITGQSALGRDEIQKMMRDAEAHADEDKRRRDEAETRNQADTVVYQTEKLLRDNADKINADEKARLEDALKGVKDALGSDDVDRVRSASESLMQVTSTVAQRMYQEAAQSGADGSGADGSTGATSADDEVVDAEIVDEGA